MPRNGNLVRPLTKESNRWKELSARLKRKYRRSGSVDCAICGREIDLTAPSGTRSSLEIDHITPVNRGGSLLDVSNLQPTHKGCNSAKSDAVHYAHVRVNTSRDW